MWILLKGLLFANPVSISPFLLSPDFILVTMRPDKMSHFPGSLVAGGMCDTVRASRGNYEASRKALKMLLTQLLCIFPPHLPFVQNKVMMLRGGFRNFLETKRIETRLKDSRAERQEKPGTLTILWVCCINSEQTTAKLCNVRKK